MSEKPKRNIYQKLIEVRKSIPYLKKDASGYGYKYSKESAVLGAIRDKMDEEGLFLETEIDYVEELNRVKVWRKEKSVKPHGGYWGDVSVVRATFNFIWVNAENPEERVFKKMVMFEEGTGCQVIGSMFTYANRYFLTKFFSIPTDDEDPDEFEKRQKEISSRVETSRKQKDEEEKKKKEEEEAYKATLSEEQAEELKDLISGDEDYLKQILGAYKIDSLSKIPQRHYQPVKDKINAYNKNKLEQEMANTQNGAKK